MRRIGIFGGSFSPVHHGHLLAARAAFERLRLDELLFVPCADSAYGKKLMPARLRLKLLRLALKGQRGFKLSDLEVKRGGVSRSVDTLRELTARAPQGTRFFLLIGQDQAELFPKWKEAAALAKLARVCVLTRPGHLKELVPKKYQPLKVPVPQCEISSTEICGRLKKRLPIDWYVPAEIAKVLSR